MDNYYHTCPPKMDDGKFLTVYSTSSTYNEAIKQGLGIVRNDDYRVYLQKYGPAMVKKLWSEESFTNSCIINNSCAHQYPLRQNPNDFYIENLQANMQLTASTLPSTMACKIYDNYTIWDDPLM